MKVKRRPLRFGSTRAAPDAALLGDVGVPGTESVDMTPSSRSSELPAVGVFTATTPRTKEQRFCLAFDLLISLSDLVWLPPLHYLCS
ncbi:hypothetical protein N7489_010750 [Penicillium chrysogenum]|uniref:Uncharacterized protein n=1 Tax=Penicillium chrysogenum TaxID=5076 RepID=A0ABQ8WTL4_PENCH|nr:uncharacterized protein N7489_010750 [Penicillium chrysogenum]KAJ5230042.1 hypothetical protein N7489_010750 [Penicillium chrysogenum]KAJ5271716.1 hypothetical protein N7524_004985 [Penicillium chrysogenum]KAJ5282066.1 hypothetical protein N7505_000046 [Penicillium chrysogenum]KAJ6140987.1 hypothetical protein N7497_011880 [Penicillium chrysogenum]